MCSDGYGFVKNCSLLAVRFSEQIMAANKYPYKFWCPIRFDGIRRVHSWVMWSVENVEHGKCGVLKIWSVENEKC